MHKEIPDPDWSTAVTVTLTARHIGHALFGTANEIHTGWDSCIDAELVTFELNAVDDGNGDNHTRLVELEYEEEDQSGVVWHDWTVEVKLGSVYIAAHWRALATAPGADWDWCAREAKRAFSGACVLVGKRVAEGIAIEELPGNASVVRH